MGDDLEGFRTFGSVEALAKCLVEAHRQGRPIIPIVGSGISANSGFPVLASIIRYFGKLQHLIDANIWLPWIGKSGEDPLREVREIYSNDPWKFIRDFGWPDRFQLNEDLQDFRNADGMVTISNTMIEGLEKLLETNENRRWQALEQLKTRLAEQLDAIRRDSDPIREADLDKLKQRLEGIFSRNKWGGSTAWDLLGEWKKMILDFTHYQGDYADALFARFAQHRNPNLGHRYLAFLIRRLGVPVVFTMNFDPFIEQTFEEEGLRPRTFAMEHGLTLPHISLIRDQLAVIKMHGSTHALLLDEQLDRPLDTDYLKRFAQIVGEKPLLLVMGCSGDDNRLRDLIRQACEGRKDAAIAVAWLHFEDTPAKIVSKYSKDTVIKFRRTRNLAGTLMHIYSAIDHLHPPSSEMYLTHFQTPMLLADAGGDPRAEKLFEDNPAKLGSLERLKKALKEDVRFILVESVTKRRANDLFPYPTASQQLLEAGSSPPSGYQLVWIDLEALHTLSAVAGAIVDQCRNFDSTLAPCVLPLDDHNRNNAASIVLHAADKVARALRRSRYYVVFDGLETYIWSPTAHHGETRSATNVEAHCRLETLTDFLLALSHRNDVGESRFAVGVDPARGRFTEKSEDAPGGREPANSPPSSVQEKATTGVDGHPSNLLPVPQLNPAQEKLGAMLALLRNKAGGTRTIEIEPLDPVDYQQPPLRLSRTTYRQDDTSTSQWMLALLVMATYRRTRPLALVYQVLQPILGSAQEVEKFLQFHQAQARPLFRQIEGGGIWFYRERRDEIYVGNTAKTGAEQMKRYLEEPRHHPCEDAVFQLMINAFTHQLVARSWYAAAFIQSHDTYALMEYFYHRLASVRALTKLLALLDEENTGQSSDQTRLELLRSQAAKGLKDFWGTVEKCAKKPDELWDFFELSEEKERFKNSDVIEVREVLKRLHCEGLHRLRLAWQRSETDLRAQVPAEQLILWCKQFLDDDLKDRCDKVITGYKDKEVNHYFVRCLERGANPTSQEALEQLRQYIEDFKSKVQMDRSEYGTTTERDKADEENEAIFQDVRTVSQANVTANFDPALIERLHRLLDRRVCDLRTAQEMTISVEDMRVEMTKCPDIMERLRDALGGSLAWPNRSAIHEVELRRLHILSNLHLGRVSVFSHGGSRTGTRPETNLRKVFEHGSFSGSLELAANSQQPIPGFEKDEALKAISNGSRRARLQSEPQASAPRSTIANAVADGTLYLPYRAIFAIQHARWRWMACVTDFSNQKDPNTASNFLLNDVDESLRELESARAGLAGTNHLALALADLYAVEASLAHARILLHPNNPMPTDATGTDCFKLARSRYETARGLLARARAALLAGQRNVVWWRLFFQLTSQYHSDRLMLGFINQLKQHDDLFPDGTIGKPLSEENRLERLSQLKLGLPLLRLRKGYESLRSGYDLHLYHEKEEMKDKLIWLPRLGWELTLCGLAIATAAWRFYRPYDDPPKFAKFRSQLLWLAKTAGFNLGQRLSNEDGERVQEQIGEIISTVPAASSPAEARKISRQKLVEMAALMAYNGHEALEF